MAASVDSPSLAHLTKKRNSKGSMTSPSPPPPPGSSSSPLLFSSDSDKCFWSSLRNRVDVLLENHPRQRLPSSGQDELNLEPSLSVGRSERAKRMKEDSLLLLRGFDSVSQTLSQLSSNLENALQGARCLAEPPTLSEILQSKNNNSGAVQEKDSEAYESDSDGEQKGLKRKFESREDDASGNGVGNLAEGEEISKNMKLKKAKKMAVSLANKAVSLAKEMKLLRSDLSFLQDRCVLLEEENKRLRDGFSKGIRPEEDDLMRLQMEVLLVEKSRLATENANLVRENQCLRQLVEYHQVTSQDISASYDEVLRGICLDFGSPSSQQMEEEEEEDGEPKEEQISKSGIAGLTASLDERFDQEQGHH